MREPKKSWIITFGVPVIAGLLVLIGLTYGLMWLANSHKPHGEQAQDESVAQAPSDQGQGGQGQVRAAASQGAPDTTAPQTPLQGPVEAASSGQAPVQAPGQAPAAAQGPGLVAQAGLPPSQPPTTEGTKTPGTQNPPSSPPPRTSRKDRIEKTAPEDRAKQAQLRMDERAYRASH